MKLKKVKRARISPYILIMLSFLAVILLGSVILFLPVSLKSGVKLKYIDALFLSTSATCVTGLSPVASINDTFTIFGKIVMIVLMEIGGLSIITIASFFMIIFGKKMGFSSKTFLTNVLNQNSPKQITNLLKKVVIMSFSIQFVFAIINTILLSKYYDNFLTTVGVAIFHTASSFNNAGFDLFGSNSMIAFRGDILLSLSTILAITLGGFGFLVLADIFSLPFNKHLSFHSKVVLLISCLLVFIPTVIFKFGMNVEWIEALFTSVTARTAGFTVLDLSSVMKENLSYPLMLLLMFIGASPASTGGGVKTTAFFTIFITIIYAIFGKKPHAFKRTIAQESIIKSFALVWISLIYIVLLTIGLKAFDANLTYHDLVFEAFSAFATVGVSMGITPILSLGSKILICITMFIGRVGPLSFVSFWANSFMEEKSANVKYVEEKIIIG